MRYAPGAVVLPILTLACLCPRPSAQGIVLSDEDYLMPPKAMADVLLADQSSNVDLGGGGGRFGRGGGGGSGLGPEGRYFLISTSSGMTPLAQMARPYVNLGETAIDPRAFRSRSLSIGTTVRYELFDWRTGQRRALEAPHGATVSGGTRSPDGGMVAYLVHADSASHVHVADVKTGKSKRLGQRRVNATLVSTLRWTSDSKQILCVLVPEKNGSMPRPDSVASTPTVRVTHPGKVPSRTYRFLMQSPHDMQLYEYLTTGQLALIRVSDGRVQHIGRPAMFRSIDIAPDGQFVRVTTVLKPFSYFVPASRFGSLDEIWDLEGQPVAKIRETKLQLEPTQRAPQAPNQRGGGGAGGDSNDKRGLAWRPDGRGMSFLQLEPAKKPEPKADKAKDQKPKDKKPKDKKTEQGQRRGTRGRAQGRQRSQGQGAQAAGSEPAKPKRKDRVMQWLPPYSKDSAKVVWESDTRISSVQYSEDCKTLFVSQTESGQTHLYSVDLNDPKKQHTIYKAKSSDFFESPGRLMTKRTAIGESAVRMSGGSVFLSGTQYFKDPSESAPRPFVDKVELASGKKTRIWQCEPDVYETVVAPVDDAMTQLITSRESATDNPDAYLRDLKAKKLKQLTHNRDFAPEITRCRRERFQVERCDGFKFWVNVTVPYKYGKKLPAMFWFYPREFTDQKSYDERQRTYNKNRFPRVSSRSVSLLTLAGYAVVEPDCPIVGPAGRMNDNFVPDLRNSLWAVIDECDKRGIIDRDRLAIGGHSYGAFGTANALAHTPFFKAGIAGDGNYNRTLTPMAFQSERRLVWDAREAYLRMSPLLWANQVNGALLMYHGVDDNNSGTFPIHAPRMLQVLDGLGKPAALYMYPYEGHGPRGRATILDLWARWVEWLEIHVRDPKRAKEMFKKKAAEGASTDAMTNEPRNGR